MQTQFMINGQPVDGVEEVSVALPYSDVLNVSMVVSLGADGIYVDAYDENGQPVTSINYPYDALTGEIAVGE